MRKVSRKSQKTKADKLFSLKIRSIGKCQLAGLDQITCGGNLQCMHVLGRANHALRWSEENALSGCQAHHVFYTNHPWEFQELIREEFPIKYAYVNKNRNTIWDKRIDLVLERLQE